MKKSKSPTQDTQRELVELINGYGVGQLNALAKIDEAISLYNSGQCDASIDCVLSAIEPLDQIGPDLIDIVTATVNEISTDATGRVLDSPKALELIRSAADRGLADYAYNVGHRLVEMANLSTSTDYSAAAKYLTQAAESATNIGLRASACVNLGVLYADGKLGKTPNLVEAMRLYEKAAQYGLVRGMINASMVCHRLSKCKDRALLDRAIAHLERAIETTKHPDSAPDLGGQVELKELQREAMVELAALNAEHPRNFVDEIKGAQSVRAFLAEDVKGSSLLHESLLRCVGRRLAKLSAKSQTASAGENWRTVLSTMDWVTGDIERRLIGVQDSQGQVQEVPVSLFDVSVGEALVPFLILDFDLMPIDDGLETLAKLAKALSEIMPRFFIWGRRPYFQQADGNLIWTYVAFVDRGDVKLVPLWPGAMPDDVMRCPSLSKNPMHASRDQGLSIAINALNEGVTTRLPYHEVMWVGVGGDWCMPFHREQTVCSMRLMPPSGHFDYDVAIAPVLVL